MSLMGIIEIIILSILSVVFAVICISFRSKNKSFEGMICKFMASFSFIGVAVVGNYFNKGSDKLYFCLIMFALMFGFCGDVFLGIKEIAPTFKKKLIPIGTSFFLIGHIFCLSAFFKLKFSPVLIIFFILGASFALIMMKILKINVGAAFTAILVFYYGLLVLKVAAAGYLVISHPCASDIITFISAALFLASDTCLSFIYFTPVKKKNTLVVAELSTYYPAQILLAASIVLR